MGHDISAIGNHRLNTKDLKVLAEDISSRIDVNIEYGYWGQPEYFKLLGENRNYEYVVLGNIVKDPDIDTVRLTDENYQLKQLHQKFGDDLFYNPDYWYFYESKLPHEKTIDEERKQLALPNFKVTTVSDDSYLSIYKELYVNDIPYFSRWWGFCRLFLESDFDNFEHLDRLLAFRKELMTYTLAFGGDKIYFLDDQSDVLEGVGQGCENELDWIEFEKFVADRTLKLMLDIPKFLTDRNYRNEFLEMNEYPLSFIDNFSDIK